MYAAVDAGIDHVLRTLDVRLDELERVVFGCVDLLERGRVHDELDAVHSPHRVAVANVAESTAAGGRRRTVAAPRMLQLVAREDDDSGGVMLIQEMPDKRFAERSCAAGAHFGSRKH